MADFKQSRGKRALAGLGALTLAAAGLLGGSTPAFAATDFGNIDTDATGTINIHKHKHQNNTDAVQNPDGSGAPIPSEGIAGVEFTAYQLTDVDLTTAGGWDDLQKINLSTACSIPGQNLGTGKIAADTNAQGFTSLSGLEVGAYLVCETDAPKEVVDRSLPFLVTVPLPWNNGWLYEINVYPKNGTTGISKSIDPQSDFGLGGKVSFPVTVDVPKTQGTELLTKFEISDTLDSRLAADGTGVSSVKVDNVDVPSAYYTVSTEGQTVKVIFNEQGRAWLKTQGEKQVVAVFAATVISVGEGKIDNDATVFINTPNDENELTSDKVNTNWGNLTILKTDNAKEATGLQGAIFEVYAAEKPYEAGTCEGAVATGDPVNVDGETQFTSGTDGAINIAGLFVSDSVNESKNATQRCYVLKEVQAPTGFVTPIDGNEFKAVAVKTGQTTGYDITITNVQQDVPDLPLTGANGQILMIIGGTAVLMVAGGMIIVNRRRATKQNNS